VLTGVDDYDAIKAEGPDMILDSVSQLTDWLSL